MRPLPSMFVFSSPSRFLLFQRSRRESGNHISASAAGARLVRRMVRCRPATHLGVMFVGELLLPGCGRATGVRPRPAQSARRIPASGSVSLGRGGRTLPPVRVSVHRQRDVTTGPSRSPQHRAPGSGHPGLTVRPSSCHRFRDCSRAVIPPADGRTLSSQTVDIRVIIIQPDCAGAVDQGPGRSVPSCIEAGYQFEQVPFGLAGLSREPTAPAVQAEHPDLRACAPNVVVRAVPRSGDRADGRGGRCSRGGRGTTARPGRLHTGRTWTCTSLRVGVCHRHQPTAGGPDPVSSSPDANERSRPADARLTGRSQPSFQVYLARSRRRGGRSRGPRCRSRRPSRSRSRGRRG